MADEKEKTLTQKAKDLAKEYSGYNLVKGVYDDLEAGNQLKKDIEGKNIVNQDGTPIKGKEGADNYAHSVTDAKIAQKGKTHATIALAGGVAKEAVDIWNKIIVPTAQGQDVEIRATLKEGWKDMQNNWRGIKWGLEHPNEDATKHFAQLDLKTNEMVEGYDNGLSKSRRATTAEIMKRDYDEAQKKMIAQKEKAFVQGQRAAQAAKKFDAGKIPDAKTPKKEKVQVPLAPKTSSVTLPIPAWQQKTKGGR